MDKQKQVLIAESRESNRKGLHAIFAEEVGSIEVHEAATSKELQDQLAKCSWDLVVVHQSLVSEIQVNMLDMPGSGSLVSFTQVFSNGYLKMGDVLYDAICVFYALAAG